MEGLLVIDNYNSLEKSDKIRVVYDKTIDLVYIDAPSLCDFIDLGLPSGRKWASCNVGATKPEEYGLYFAWGETEGYSGITSEKQFNLGDYKHTSGGSYNTLSKYNSGTSYGVVVDNLTTLELVDDAAYVSDNTCRMPTSGECKELIDNTTSTWETLNGVYGRRFTSKTNGNSIFIPAAGECSNGSVSGVGSYCKLWSSSLGNFPSEGSDLFFYSVSVYMFSSSRHYGYSVRAVL